MNIGVTQNCLCILVWTTSSPEIWAVCLTFMNLSFTVYWKTTSSYYLLDQVVVSIKGGNTCKQLNIGKAQQMGQEKSWAGGHPRHPDWLGRIALPPKTRYVLMTGMPERLYTVYQVEMKSKTVWQGSGPRMLCVCVWVRISEYVCTHCVCEYVLVGVLVCVCVWVSLPVGVCVRVSLCELGGGWGCGVSTGTGFNSPCLINS